MLMKCLHNKTLFSQFPPITQLFNDTFVSVDILPEGGISQKCTQMINGSSTLAFSITTLSSMFFPESYYA